MSLNLRGPSSAALSATYAGLYGNMVIGDGDSITIAGVDSAQNVFGDAWYTYLTVNSDGRLPYVFNAGHGGYSSVQLLALLDAEAIGKLPAGRRIIWAAGRNDAQTPALTIAGDKEFVRRARAAGMEPILATIPPTGMLALPSPDAPTATPSATGGTLAAGTYGYTIVAKNSAGATLPSASTPATTTGSTGSVVLTWPAIKGATGYDIYRGSLKIGSATIATAPAPAFTDTGQAAAGAPPASNTTAVATITADRLHTATVNSWRKRYGRIKGITVIDFYDVLADPATGSYQAGLSTDGTHPSLYGQKLMGLTAWNTLSADVKNAKGYIAEDQLDPLNKYTNGLFLSGGVVPSGFAGVPSGYTTTVGALAGFKGNAWTVERLASSAGTYLGQVDLALASVGSIGDTIQFSCKVQKTGADTGGMFSETGARFVNGTGPVNLALWKLSADITDPTRLVSPEVVIPTGTTALRLINYLYGGIGKISLGQFTVVNLTTAAIISA